MHVSNTEPIHVSIRDILFDAEMRTPEIFNQQLSSQSQGEKYCFYCFLMFSVCLAICTTITLIIILTIIKR